MVGRLRRDFAGLSGRAAPYKSEKYGVTWPGGYPEYVFGSPGAPYRSTCSGPSDSTLRVELMTDDNLPPAALSVRLT